MRTPTILLVDDEPTLLKMMTVALARHKWQVYQAKDAATALEMAATLSCGLNVLVTDLVMPDTQGDELIGRVRRMCPYVDVLLISGALPEGSSGLPNARFLKKPFDMTQLANVIRDMLSVQLQ